MSEIRICPRHSFYEGQNCSQCSKFGRLVLSPDRRDTVSKFLSGLLRHFPSDYGLEVDEDGWADYTEVRKILNTKYNASEVELLAIVCMDSKNRYSINESEIRAMYGHSISGVSVDGETHSIPDVLYHGTSKLNAQLIRNEGILPQSRNKVHLSETLKDAISVGQRHSKSEEVVVFTIDANALVEDGWEIETTNNEVYTVEKVKPEYFTNMESY